MKLADVQQAVHGVLRGAAPLQAGAEALGIDPARLAIYRRFVRRHVEVALSAEFPHLKAALGADRWSDLYAAYYEAHPPSAPTLPEAAAAFPDFLAAQYEAGRFGLSEAHLALADFEWALYEVSIDGAPWPTPTSRSVNPTLSILSFEYDVATFALEGMGEGPWPESPTLVLAFQHPARRTARWHRARPELLLALKIAHEGLTPSDAAAATGAAPSAVEAALAFAVEVGLLV